MKKLILIFLLAVSFSAIAQKTNEPIVLVDHMLASTTFLKKLDQKKIKSKTTYKSNFPKQLLELSKATPEGIISVELKSNDLDRVSLEDLNKDYKLPADQPVYFDNIRITNNQVKILGDVLQKIEVITKDGEKFLNISTTPVNN